VQHLLELSRMNRVLAQDGELVTVQAGITLGQLYPGWDRFQEVRARLDPKGKFMNDYCERMLG
jgi:FAD/FMN-containing dehydrogenase